MAGQAGRSLAARVLEGEVRAASRLMRLVEDGEAAATVELQALFPHTGRAYIVGITGPPGAGKSTLTGKLVGHYRGLGKRVGVLAVDPTSPFTGGAVLGDRIRMQEHALDPDVFIRSLATRGHLGGLSRATADCLHVMDAMGKDVILVETVGVGQDETEIAGLAHTTIVVLVPGMGDDIQAIKAGILEVADVYAINKCDLPGADRVVRELRGMIELGARRGPSGRSVETPWETPILKLTATRDEGLSELGETLERHRAHLDETGERLRRERARASAQFVALLRERLLSGALARLAAKVGHLDEVAESIARRQIDPYALVDALAREP